jgi:ketosteroid isomerase-like protein
MEQLSDIVRNFFEEYERSINASDSEGAPEFIASRYSDSFMFAGPQGAQAVNKEGFLKALPKRQWFFKSIGLTSTTIQSLEETRLDDNYVMVKTSWNVRFEKEAGQPIVAEARATYVLRQEESSLRIVFQIDHQDLMRVAQDSGLLPAKD